MPSHASVVQAIHDTQIAETYHIFLARNVEPQALGFWSHQANSEGLKSVLTKIASSPESASNFVTGVYRQFLGRTPAQAEVGYWVGLLESKKLTPDLFEARILGSNEFFGNAGGTNAGFVTALYQSVLGRTPSTAESTFWVGEVASGTSRNIVALSILGSAEDLTNQVDNVYATVLGRNGANDPNGVNFWVHQRQLLVNSELESLRTGSSVENVGIDQIGLFVTFIASGENSQNVAAQVGVSPPTDIVNRDIFANTFATNTLGF